MSTQRRRDGWDLARTIQSSRIARQQAIEEANAAGVREHDATLELIALLEANSLDAMEHDHQIFRIGRNSAGKGVAINIEPKQHIRGSMGITWPESQPTELPPPEPADDEDLAAEQDDVLCAKMAATFNPGPPDGTGEIDDPAPVARAS